MGANLDLAGALDLERELAMSIADSEEARQGVAEFNARKDR